MTVALHLTWSRDGRRQQRRYAVPQCAAGCAMRLNVIDLDIVDVVLTICAQTRQRLCHLLLSLFPPLVM